MERREAAEKAGKKKKKKAKKKAEIAPPAPVAQKAPVSQKPKQDGFTVVKKGALMAVQPQSLDTTMSLLAMQLDESTEEEEIAAVEELDEWTQ